MLFSLLLPEIIAKKIGEDVNFNDKNCKTLTQWNNQDFITVSSSKEICVNAETDAFVIVGAKDIVITDEEGKTYNNAYGACSGKYLIKTNSETDCLIGLNYIPSSATYSNENVFVLHNVFLVTKQNWNSKLELNAIYRGINDFDLSYSEFVVFNDNVFLS